MDLTGCGTALITPFRSDGSVDEQALYALAQWQVESGVNWIVACGTTGETPTLTDDEWPHVVRIIAEAVAGRIPVWAGVTHNSTREAVARARTAAGIPGVTAILCASPYYNKPPQEGLFEHFKAVARATSLPLVVYNIPSRTGVNLEPATILRLIEAAPSVQGVKESSSNLAQITSLIAQAPEGFRVYSGDDNMILGILGVGGAGLVSVTANEVPAEMAQMVQAALTNEWSTARRLNRKYFRLIEANFCESNPGPVKAVLAMMGKCGEYYRLPLVPVSSANRTRLERIAGELGLLIHAPRPEGDFRMF
ncbi:MAG: 4-hydroxy-tetrahydrodipicolinate synthase [Acidobacteriaceae bacterium]